MTRHAEDVREVLDEATVEHHGGQPFVAAALVLVRADGSMSLKAAGPASPSMHYGLHLLARNADDEMRRNGEQAE